MANRFGWDTFAGIGKETVYGTSVARTIFHEINKESGGYNPGRKPIDTWRKRAPVAYVDAGAKVTRSLGAPLTYESFERIIQGVLWEYAYLQKSAGPPARNEHTFSLGTTPPVSLTIEVPNSEANAMVDAGCQIRKVQIDFSPDSEAQISYDYVGQSETMATKSGSPTFTALDTLIVKPSQIACKIANVTYELNSFSLSIEAGFDEGRTKFRGGKGISQPMPMQRANITATLARDWNSSAVFDQLLDAANSGVSSVALLVTCTGPTLSGGNYSLVINVPKAVVMGDPPTHDGPGIVIENLKFEAMHDGTDTACKIVLTNSVAQLT